MKNLYILLFSAIVFVVAPKDILAQKSLSKQEIKDIKAKLKSFKKQPETYKSMITNYDKSIKDRDAKMEAMELEIERLKKRYENDMKACEDSMNAQRERLAAALKAQASQGSATLPAGTAYGVQIGNYKFFDITQYFGKDKYLTAYNENDATQYVIIYFTDPKMADACRMDIQKLGIKDAFVTKYVDGKRVPFDIRNEVK